MDRLISEQAVLEAVSRGCCELRGIYARCEDSIKAIPSAEPKTGHWIKGNIYEGIYCSECETNAPTDYDFHYMRSIYCPNCGCRMVEPQESEDEE